MNTTTKTTNRRNNNRNQSTRSNGGTKRGYSSRSYRAPQYFVIQADTNEKVVINDKEHNILSAWLELKAQESHIKDQMDAMKAAVVEVISETGGAVKFRGFEMTTKVRRTYAFSATATDIETELKNQKAEEIKCGTAEITRQTEFVEVRVIGK